jgi:hypothetical protein
MKTRIKWDNCHLHNNKTSFWVECTDEEVEKYILPHSKQKELEKEVELNRGENLIFKNQSEYCNFFLISYDYSHISSYPWQMPFSGLWNGYNPFTEFEVIEFYNLNELKSIIKIIETKNTKKEEYRKLIINTVDFLIQTRQSTFNFALNLAMKNDLKEIDDVFEEGDTFSFCLNHLDGGSDINVQKVVDLIREIESTVNTLMNINAIDDKELTNEI